MHLEATRGVLPPPLLPRYASGMARLKAQQRREQLIEVATKLFARHGYEATTTARIAEKAGVTEPILYRHFSTKQELFVAIVREVSELTIRKWRELAARGDNATDRIRLIAEEFPRHIEKLADAYHVIHGALATSRDPDVMAVMREHYAQFEAFFIGIVRDGQQAGLFHSDMDPRVPAWQLISIGIGYAMIALNLERFDPSLISQAVEFILRGLHTAPAEQLAGQSPSPLAAELMLSPRRTD